jgi:hypothetical protein
MNYGEVLDIGFDPVREKIYPLFVEYFNDPTMTKIKNINGYSMYMAKTYCLLGIEYRYIIVFVREDKLPMLSKTTLENLRWISLQTRSLADEHNLPSHSYVPRRIPDLDQKITLVKQNSDQFVYKVEKLPITVTLLPKTKGMDYNPSGSVVTALETYQTIINFI